MKCNPTCNECSSIGDNNKHNCTSCVKNHHFFEKEVGNCIMEGTQPINYFFEEKNNSYKECFEKCRTCSKYKDENSENCLTCDQDEGYYLIYNQPGNCVNEDPGPGPDYYLNPVNNIQKTFEKCNYNFCTKCSENEWYYISRYIGHSFYCQNNDEGTIFNMQIYKNSDPSFNKSQSFINTEDVLKCENILKSQGLLGKREEIIVVKRDYINISNNEIENVEFDFYKKKRNSGNLELSTKLNITSCKEIDFLITIPRNLSNYYNSKYLNFVLNAYNKLKYDNIIKLLLYI